MIRTDLRFFNIHPFETAPMEVQDYLNVDPNAQDDDGHTVVHKYVSNRSFDVEMMRRFKSNGANLELRNSKGKTAFLLAVVLRQTKMIEAFIESKADVKVKDNSRNNALHYMVLPELIYDIEHAAVWEGFESKDTLSILKLLLDKGVDVNARNRRGETPLMWAARGEHLKMVQMLLQYGANVHLRDAGMATCLFFTIDYSELDHMNESRWGSEKYEVLSELIRNKACVNCFDKHGFTVLFYILRSDHQKMQLLARELIKSAAVANYERRIVFHCSVNHVLGAKSNEKIAELYVDCVYREISWMEVHELPGGYNLCDFVRGGVSEDELSRTPEIRREVLKILLLESFTIHDGLVLNMKTIFAPGSKRLCSFYQRRE